MKQVVMVVGGSKWQLDIIKSVKNHGFHTLVTDISADAPGKAIADIFCQVDSENKEALLELARQHKIAFAIAEQTDRVVPVVAYINEHLNLKGIKPDVALSFTDKYIMRTTLNKSGLAMPRFYLVSTKDETVAKAKELGYPVILKPRSSQSSFGVFKIYDEKELVVRFEQSLKYSKDGTLLLEEYIPGTEITVEGFCINQKCYPLAISEKEHYPENDCVSRKLIYPPTFNDALITSIKKYIIQTVETLGLNLGIFHAELKVFEDKIYLIEVAARGGGHKIASIIVPHISGVNMYDLLINGLNGESVAINNIQQKAAVLGFFDFAPGKIKKIKGLEKIRDDKRIFEIHFNFKEGDEIKKAQDDVTRAGYYIAFCDDRKELNELDKLILSSVYLEYNS